MYAEKQRCGMFFVPIQMQPAPNSALNVDTGFPYSAYDKTNIKLGTRMYFVYNVLDLNSKNSNPCSLKDHRAIQKHLSTDLPFASKHQSDHGSYRNAQ